jgi:hypothetical protein
MTAYGINGGTASLNFNFFTRCGRVFSFQPRLLYPGRTITGALALALPGIEKCFFV